jgi:hypothetical protein
MTSQVWYSEPHGDIAKSLEAEARAKLDSLMSTRLTDEDWRRTSMRLVDFVAILRSWEGDANVEHSKRRTPVIQGKDTNGTAELDKAA